MNIDILNFAKENMPYTVDDVYLKDNKKQIKAVCSNNSIAKFLADCVNSFIDIDIDIDGNKRTKLYQEFISSAIYLKEAILKANIPVNSIEMLFVEKSFNVFCKQLELIKCDINGKE